MFIWLLTLCCLFYYCNSQTEYWVKPLSGSSHGCPEDKPCLTLSEYVTNSTAYFTSNTTFHFLPGTHCVMNTTNVIIENVKNLSLESSASSPTEQVGIDGKGRLMFAFVSVGDLHISGLHFENCGLEIPENLLTYIPEGLGLQQGTQAALVVYSVDALALENVTVEWSIGFGLLGFNIPSTTMANCKFRYNNWRVNTNQTIVQNKRAEDWVLLRHGTNDGGNVLLVYNDFTNKGSLRLPVNLQRNITLLLNITKSEFTNGMTSVLRSSTICTPIIGSGLSVYFSLFRAHTHLFRNYYFHKFSALIHDSVFYDNIACYGANMLFSFRDYTSVVIRIHNCSFHNGRSYMAGGGLYIGPLGSNSVISITRTKFIGNHAEEGGGIFFDVDFDADTEFKVHESFQLKNCNFSNNTGTNGSALFIYYAPTYMQPVVGLACHVSLSKTVFRKNTANESGAVYILIGDDSNVATYVSSLRVCIEETAFTENRAKVGSAVTINASMSAITIVDMSAVTIYRNGGVQTFGTHDSSMTDSAAVLVDNVGNGKVRLSNSNFSENAGTAILAFNSSLYLEGEVRLLNNYGYSGGALALARQSFLYLEPHARVYITNNTAILYGGGIAVAVIDDCNSHTEYCFFQIDNLLNFSILDIKVILKNNRAGEMGDSIYGGNLDSCLLTDHTSTHVYLNQSTFWSFFEIIGEQSPSEIAASPYKVCFCSNKTVGKSCPIAKNVSHFKGETFHVAVLGTGQYGYASPAIVRVYVKPDPGYSAELGERQNVQEISAKCDNITLSIRTPEESTVLELSIENPLISDSQQSILRVSFRSCPFGFSLSGDPPKCDCADHLKKPGVSCSIDNQLIHRPAAVWIGNYSNDVVIHSHCPFDYCKPEDNEISLHQQDEQCALNRACVLCGACQPGLSLALGSSRCMQCSNVWILLFVPFTVAGVALVILLLKCNLTVSTGTVNGLIFYANIIRVNHSIFFPPGKINPITQLLAVIIAWVNLDLGIETCLFEGMTAFIKTWLQFLFPIYIWVMVGLMIIVSRYSTTVSRLTGYNTVSVLATLFLLSYAKLLRTITTTLSFTTLSDRNGHTSAVWLLDGNVGFLKGPHISLFIGSLLALLGFVLPFALLVLLAPFLQASTHYHVQKLVNKFKPLLDAYQGPYKDRFRFWTGFMLWVRIVLFTAFASNALGDPQVNLLVIVLSVLFLFVILLKTGGVYKNSINEMVEWFFLLNLGTFAVSTLFLRSLENFSVKRQEILTGIMVGSAFSVFLGILAYHCYGYLKKAGVVDWMHVHFKPRPALQQYAHPDNAVGAEFNGSGAQVQDAQPTFTEIRLDELREPLMTDN